MVFQSMLRGSTEVKAFAPDVPFNDGKHFDDPAYPRLHFVEQRYAGDWTSWWIPNSAAAEAMLRSAGFSVIGHPEEEIFICHRLDRPPWPRPAEEVPWSRP